MVAHALNSAPNEPQRHRPPRGNHRSKIPRGNLFAIFVVLQSFIALRLFANVLCYAPTQRDIIQAAPSGDHVVTKAVNVSTLYNNAKLQQQHHQANGIQNRDQIARKLAIVHITPLYKVENCKRFFCPYDREQSITIASMSRARREASKADVALVTSVFPEDGEAVPSDFIRLSDLRRSTVTEYPELNPTKKLPFANDILDNLKDWKGLDSFDYVIYTNVDIIVRNNFYDLVAAQVEKGYDGFTVNRQTVPRNKDYTSGDLDEIYNLEGIQHPGADCFVMKVDIFRQLYLGDVFLGYLGFAKLMKIQLESYAEKFKVFKTAELNATYHLGNDRSWQTGRSSDRAFALQNIENAYNLDVWPNICQFEVYRTAGRAFRKRNTVYEGNTASCTSLAHQFWCEDLDPCKVAMCRNATHELPVGGGCHETTKVGQWYKKYEKQKSERKTKK